MECVLSCKPTSLLSLLLTAVTMDTGGKLASNICPILSICLYSFMCLSMVCGSFSFSNSLSFLPFISLK